jgi:hypothetical protein
MQVAKYISVLLASTLKFVGGPLAGLALGLSWPETAVCTVLGMMLSVSAVVFAGAILEQLLARFRRGPTRLFSRRTRLAVWVWQRAGMAGIAFLTPLLLTPIGGTALAVSLRVGRAKLLIYMLLSAVFWAVVQTLVLYELSGKLLVTSGQ